MNVRKIDNLHDENSVELSEIDVDMKYEDEEFNLSSSLLKVSMFTKSTAINELLEPKLIMPSIFFITGKECPTTGPIQILLYGNENACRQFINCLSKSDQPDKYIITHNFELNNTKFQLVFLRNNKAHIKVHSCKVRNANLILYFYDKELHAEYMRWMESYKSLHAFKVLQYKEGSKNPISKIDYDTLSEEQLYILNSSKVKSVTEQLIIILARQLPGIKKTIAMYLTQEEIDELADLNEEVMAPPKHCCTIL